VSAEAVIQSLVAGVLIGSVYGLMCMGLAVIFGIMRVINFAQGEFLMLGMYALLFLVPILAALGLGGAVGGPLVATLVTAPLLFAVGYVLHASMLGPATRIRTRSGEAQSQQAQFIITLGISIVLQNACMILFGADIRSVRTPISSSAWAIPIPFTEDGLVFVNHARLLTFLAGVALAIGLHLLIGRTWIGKILRATSDNPVAALYMSIDVEKVHRFAFALGTAITAVAGALVALQFPFQPFIGLDFVIVMYAGVVLGGMGSVMGAFWGGLTIGVIQQASTAFLPNQLQNVTLFVVFLAILFVRPQGFFGRSSERA
jgi:branched-chain amino acid transport system permease protein